MSLEDALRSILVESAELCSSVRAAEIEETVIVELNNVKSEPEAQIYREFLGSLPTSLSASLVAAVRGKPVVIEHEEVRPNKTIARLKIVEKTVF